MHTPPSSVSLISHISLKVLASFWNVFLLPRHVEKLTSSITSFEHILIPSLTHPTCVSPSLSPTPLFAAVWNFPSTVSAAVPGRKGKTKRKEEGGKMQGECLLTPPLQKKPEPLWWRTCRLISLHKFSGKIPDGHKDTEAAEMETHWRGGCVQVTLKLITLDGTESFLDLIIHSQILWTRTK